MAGRLVRKFSDNWRLSGVMLTAIIVAAGSSRRMGFDKLFATLADKPVIAHSIAAFQRTGSVDAIVIVGRAGRLGETIDLVRAQKFDKVREIVAGGEHRQDSVRLGLDRVPEDAQFIAIHDAARPLIRPDEIEQIYDCAKVHGAAAAAAPVTDTLKRVDDQSFVCGGIDRDRLFAMQTPQIFARALIEQAYREVVSKQLSVTDEVSAVQQIGHKVMVVPNDQFNFKITFEHDLAVAELLWGQRQQHA